MPSSNTTVIQRILDSAPPLPMSAELWQKVVSATGLSPKQAQLTELIMRGLSDKQIALVMGLREPTVRTYVARIFERTHTSSRVQLAMCMMGTTLEAMQKKMILTEP